MKNRFNTIKWNRWQGMNRELEIDNTIEKLALPWVVENPDLNILHRNVIPNDIDTSCLGKDFTMEEINRSIRRSNAKSFPGKDGIDYYMIKFLPEKFKIKILKLLNYAFNNSYMFQNWREVITIFIDKPDKHKVRPITMSSCLLKLMERIINDRLTW